MIALKILAAICALVILIIVAIALLPSNTWRGPLARYISHATGRTAKIEGKPDAPFVVVEPRDGHREL
jgi:hypothetical protein